MKKSKNEIKISEIKNKVIENVINIIENNSELKWVKPWAEPLGMLPHNAKSGHRYTGINSFILSFYLLDNGKSDGRFATYNQAKQITKLDYPVKKGAKSISLLRPSFSYFNKETKKYTSMSDAKKQAKDFLKSQNEEDSEPSNKQIDDFMKAQGFKKIIYYMPFNVFHVEDIHGIPELEKEENLDKDKDIDPTDTEKIDYLYESSGAMRAEGLRACYMPSSDVIMIPPEQNFFKKSEFGATLLHEWFHWTGHESRENRDMSVNMHDPKYAFEELRAEIFSVMACMHFGYDIPIENHAGYIKSWKNRLKEEPQAMYKALDETLKIFEGVINVFENKQPDKLKWFPDKSSWPSSAEETNNKLIEDCEDINNDKDIEKVAM
jgi:antirestriction protein ArdC